MRAVIAESRTGRVLDGLRVFSVRLIGLLITVGMIVWLMQWFSAPPSLPEYPQMEQTGR